MTSGGYVTSSRVNPQAGASPAGRSACRSSARVIARALLERQADLPAGLAPACGLTLLDVTYPPEVMARTGIQ